MSRKLARSCAWKLSRRRPPTGATKFVRRKPIVHWHRSIQQLGRHKVSSVGIIHAAANVVLQCFQLRRAHQLVHHRQVDSLSPSKEGKEDRENVYDGRDYRMQSDRAIEICWRRRPRQRQRWRKRLAAQLDAGAKGAGLCGWCRSAVAAKLDAAGVQAPRKHGGPWCAPYGGMRSSIASCTPTFGVQAPGGGNCPGLRPSALSRSGARVMGSFAGIGHGRRGLRCAPAGGACMAAYHSAVVAAEKHSSGA